MLKGEIYEGLGVDIWSAGVILFAMSCGYLPFENNENQVELYQKIMNGEYNITVSLSEQLKDLIKRILTVNPLNRIKIDEIRKHPWMSINGIQQQSSRGIIIGYNKIPIDLKILNGLSENGIDV
jgi:5'-AMP-activated protein kinase catalytic alpha subunit